MDEPTIVTADFQNGNQYNLFAYAFNDPINMSDNEGYWPKWAKNLAKVAVGAAAIGIGVLATAATGGAAAPVLVASLKIAATSAAIGAASGAGISAVSHRVSTGSWEGAGKAAVTGAIDGACDGFMLGGVSAGLAATTNALQVAGKIPKRVKLDKLSNNPNDPYVTVGPKQGEVVRKINEINSTGRYEYPYVKPIENGMYEIQNGHHTIAALRSIGRKSVNVWLVK